MGQIREKTQKYGFSWVRHQKYVLRGGVCYRKSPMYSFPIFIHVPMYIKSKVSLKHFHMHAFRS